LASLPFVFYQASGHQLLSCHLEQQMAGNSLAFLRSQEYSGFVRPQLRAKWLTEHPIYLNLNRQAHFQELQHFTLIASRKAPGYLVADKEHHKY
jgi:hypothetical protein